MLIGILFFFLLLLSQVEATRLAATITKYVSVYLSIKAVTNIFIFFFHGSLGDEIVKM